MDARIVRNLQPGQWYGTVERAAQVGGVNLSIVHHPHARRIEPHTHALAYFILLVSGRYEETHEEVTARYEPFSIAFHAAGMTHWDEIIGETTQFAVELSPAWETRIGVYFDTSGWRLELQHGEAVWLAVRLMNLFLDENLEELEADSIVSEMLGIALRTVERDHSRRAWIDDVKKLLHEQFTESISLESLAQRVGVHPASLARGFRLEEGTTVGDYVMRLRIQHACRLMSNTSRSLADVAGVCGFADQSHLTRVFKSITGLPPGLFRERRILDAQS